jgi:flagellar biogenesis protein FliO
MSVKSTPAGIRVRAACQNSGMPVGFMAPPFRLPGKDHANQPSPYAPQVARVRSPAQSESLRAALALPAEATDTEKEGDLPPADDLGHGAGAAETAGKQIPAGAAAPVGSENTAESVAANAGTSAAPVKPAPIAPSTQADAPAAALASTDAPSPSSAGSTWGEGKSSSSTVSTVLVVLLLVGLGVAATIASRRRATRTRMIRIVETASIGPRRSLVVARIGGRTMVLGVSEAGVSLLDAQAGSITLPPTFERAQSASLAEAALGGFGHAEAQEESSPSADDGKHEESLLRLFHRVEPPSEIARRAHEFDSVFRQPTVADSVSPCRSGT